MIDLNDLYREVIMDHYRNPRNQGTLPTPPALSNQGHNPLCGDDVTVYVNMEDDVVTDVKIQGSGCSISQSSASMMTNAIKGKSTADIQKLIGDFKEMMAIHEKSISDDADDNVDEAQPGSKLGDLEALRGVVQFPVRIKCASLSWITLEQAISES